VTFVLKMAWRDSRASRRRLLVFSFSIVLGIAALVAIGSTSANLQRAIDREANGLLGADLVISGGMPATDDWQRAIDGLGGEVSRERFFASTVVLGEQVRRLQIRAIGGGYPFYGEFITVPADAPAQLKRGGNVAIVDEALLDELKMRVGGVLKIRDVEFKIIGALVEFPGEPPITATFQPRVFIPFEAIPDKGGKTVNRLDIKLPPEASQDGIVRSLKDRFPEARIVFTTAQDRRRAFETTLANLDAFFRLVGFVALFLGAIGVASVVNVYIRQKIATVAVLRCLGASARQSFAIYLVQGTALGGFGAVLGAIVGIAGQAALPTLLKDVVPFHLEFFISWTAVANGMASGFVICMLFTLLPLLAVRRVPPLAALRSALAETEEVAFDPWRVAIAVLIPVAVASFAIWQTHNLKFGIGYAAALGAAFAILAATAKLVSWAAKRWFPRNAPYLVRQSVANLYRPHNRTVLLLLSLGLGAFLCIALYLARTELLFQIKGPEGGGRPNLWFQDVEAVQMDPLASLLAKQGAPIVEKIPFIRIKLVSVNGKPPERPWSQRFGKQVTVTATYQNHLNDDQVTLEGKFVGRAQGGAAVVPVSIARNLAGRNGLLKLGDEAEWDVQGVPMRTRVAAIFYSRGLRLTPPFEILFPSGVLEGAPAYYQVGARAATKAISTQAQRAVTASFPAMRMFDLAAILEVVDRVFNKIAFVVGFMASFIVATGVIMLAGAVLTGRFQRIRETVLLRTLGASRRQILLIQAIEYAVLGVLASSVGAILAVGGNLLLAHLVFKIEPVTPPLLLVAAVAAVTAVTLLTGWIANRGVIDHPPLAVLRQET